MNEFNSTEDLGEIESGERESVVGSPESLAGGGRAGVADPQEEHGTAETASGGGETAAEGAPSAPDGAGREDARRQSREENAAIRAARLRAVSETRAKAQAETDEEIAGFGLTDPYSGKPIASMRELREYGGKLRAAKLAEQAKRTGRSVAELDAEEKDRTFVSRLRAESERRQAEEEAQARQARFAARDLADFTEKHADVDVEKLIGNQRFLRFCGTRMGREPLAALYEDFCALVSDTAQAAAIRAERRSARSTGSGGAGGAAMLSPAQKRALDAWNAENPDMAMTAREFLGR